MAPISQQLPALYATTKGDDFREAAALVDFGSPAVVMVAGENAAWLVEEINDYSWLRGSPTIAIDAAALDDAAIAVIEASMVVRGAVLLSQPENEWGADPPAGWRLETPSGIAVLTPTSSLSASRLRIGVPELGGDPRRRERPAKRSNHPTRSPRMVRRRETCLTCLPTRRMDGKSRPASRSPRTIRSNSGRRELSLRPSRPSRRTRARSWLSPSNAQPPCWRLFTGLRSGQFTRRISGDHARWRRLSVCIHW